MTTEEKLDRLTNIVDALAASVVARDKRIEALNKITDRDSEETERLDKQVENL